KGGAMPPAATDAAMSSSGGRAAPSPAQERPPRGGEARPQGSERRPPASVGAVTTDLAIGLVVALAHPDRIARLRPGGSTYLMTSGTGATLAQGSPLVGQTWLAIADADRGAGRSDATIRSAAPIDADLALEAAAPMLAEEDV